MAGDQTEEKTLFQRVMPLTWAGVVIALLYVGWVFYSRHQENREYTQKAVEKAAADNRAVAEAYGGNRLEILNFTAPEAVVKRGERTRLCYSVSNATKVTIAPDVNDVRPSYSNCVETTIKKDTTYTLTAQDNKGNAQTATLTIRTTR